MARARGADARAIIKTTRARLPRTRKSTAPSVLLRDRRTYRPGPVAAEAK